MIRQAAAADIAPLVDLTLRTIRASYRPFLGDAAVERYIASGEVRQFLTDHIEQTTVSLVAEQHVGYAISCGNSIEQMMVDVGHHRFGLGSALLAHVERGLFADHATLTLESFLANEQANNFYRKHGWREVGQRFDEEYGITMLTFEKTADGEEAAAALMDGDE